MSGIDDDDFVDLGPDEISAIEKSYGSLIAKPDPELAARAAKEDPAPPKAASKPAKAEAQPAAESGKPAAGEDWNALRSDLANAQRLAAEERAKREAAEIASSRKDVHLAVANADVIANQHSTVANARKNAESAVDDLRRRHQAAQESGDYETASKTMEELADAKYRVNVLRDGEEELKARHAAATEKAKAMAEAPPPRPTETKPVDGVEDFVSKLPPREQAWAREHMDAFRDPRLSKKIQGLHALAEADGIAPGSDAYFAHLDKGMGYSKASDEAAGDDVVVETRKEAAPAKPVSDEPKRVAAPVSRGGIQAGSDGRMRVQLTKAQIEVAEAMGMSKTDYAKHLLALQNASRDPNYAGPRLSGAA